MTTDRSLTKSELKFTESSDFFWDVEYAAPPGNPILLRPRSSYREILGNEPLRVGIVEFRIMLFLASRPYHAYTRRQIADAASREDHALTEATVDSHIASLRNQLGAFHDFIQAVPQVGYRFKA